MNSQAYVVVAYVVVTFILKEVIETFEVSLQFCRIIKHEDLQPSGKIHRVKEMFRSYSNEGKKTKHCDVFKHKTLKNGSAKAMMV